MYPGVFIRIPTHTGDALAFTSPGRLHYTGMIDMPVRVITESDPNYDVICPEAKKLVEGLSRLRGIGERIVLHERKFRVTIKPTEIHPDAFEEMLKAILMQSFPLDSVHILGQR